ncbi:putative protein kinase RLK-Pelle-LRR-XI-1 family [Helianthus annuus]|nr:putative protein kinase RLK-Pelle-LRR-XI-1 family [Helianthus annuus]
MRKETTQLQHEPFLLGTDLCSPEKIGSWADFEYIDVSENFLTGKIPPDMCKNGKIYDIFDAAKQFHWWVVGELCELLSLERLRVSNNSLSGRIPDGIWSLPLLKLIDLAMNQFKGPVTSNIGEAKSLAQLFVSNNRFSSELPEEISNVSSLVEMELMYIQFSSGIPLSGDIPASLGSLWGLNSLNVSDNKLSGVIPASLSSLKFSLIDFSNNMLVGRVSESLLAEAYDGSFAGNLGLSADNGKSLLQCSLVSHRSSGLGVAKYCFIAGAFMLVFSVACFVLFHVISFDEGEILGSLIPRNLIGIGGSDNVYEVELGCGKKLAVKHMWRSGLDSGDPRSYLSSATILPKKKSRWPEYDAEVATLSSIRHVNVVKLYCSITNDDSNLLVHKYMPNGSLWDRLHTYKKAETDWNVRYKITMGAAKGLEYLHHGCDRPVILRDVKSKYGYTFNVTEKSDIYSFGVVLIELVTRRKPVEPKFGENKDIVRVGFMMR